MRSVGDSDEVFESCDVNEVFWIIGVFSVMWHISEFTWWRVRNGRWRDKDREWGEC